MFGSFSKKEQPRPAGRGLLRISFDLGRFRFVFVRGFPVGLFPRFGFWNRIAPVGFLRGFRSGRAFGGRQNGVGFRDGPLYGVCLSLSDDRADMVTHRDVAAEMLKHGGLLTEYTTQTQALPNNFRQRNRIVAGLCDATILVESAIKGGGLITCRVAMEYGRDVFAFPGAVGHTFSEGCNHMIRNNIAGLITSASDFLESMGWKTEKQKTDAIERQLFPDLTPEEAQVVSVLQKTNDLQLNMISVKSNIPIGQLTALLFAMEMKGIVKPLAGGAYHLYS